jgi:hypothetical protein
LSSLAFRPVSSVNTFRSTLPGKYGHGEGFVTKNLGKRNGALMVSPLFMRLVNALEKSWWRQELRAAAQLSRIRTKV